MFESLTKLFGGGFNSRTVNQYMKIVERVNRLEHDISKLSDKELQNKTNEFKNLLNNGKTLDDILPEAFAVVREASKRVLGLRHFDVQLVGGITLHKGQIAEMKTGEGKTLVATAPVYLNALTGKGVHVVTVNDYLAKRDGEQMGQVYNFLGLSTSVILSGMSDSNKKEAYAADITYGTNHEFGFDYLRDNLKYKMEDMVMRPFNYAVVDEIDSILIDEARTPLIISGQDDNASQMYIAVDAIIKTITDTDYELDQKTRVINLTEQGVTKVEKALMNVNIISRPLYDPSNVSVVYYVNCALRANKLFKKDVDYMVKNGQILIIDEFTGRAMEGRRYSEGLHQALEAKEGVEIQAESQTIAAISYQNLFRLYPKLSGMTGTAMTEEAEFDEIYKLKVVSIPPNKPVIRIDNEDSIYLTMKEKDAAVIKLIKDCVKRKQPVLVGTTNLDRSEYISSLLIKEGIKHNVLNAKQHEREAYIISEAGAPGSVTIATNMAGRGTDIKLGGCVETRIMFECANIENEEEKQKKIETIKKAVQLDHDKVVKAGGLFVIGTERNESRRIDNQLRGRSGRQGDPGASKYFLSLEDELIKRFGSPNLGKTLQKLGVKENEDLTHRWISKAIAKAQKRVEDYNFDIRKQLLKYDDVMNEQRKIIYEQRLKIIQSADTSDYVDGVILDTLDYVCNTCIPQEAVPFEWKLDDLQIDMKHIFDIDIDKEQISNDTNLTCDLFKQKMQELVINKFKDIKSICNESALIEYEKELILMTLDNAWKKHLVTLEHVRRSINLQAYAQKNPLNEYKFEAFSIFDTMLGSVKKDVTTHLMHLRPQQQEQPRDMEEILEEIQKSLAITSTGDILNFISRNSPCTCGSGKKYKDCCGKLTALNFQQPDGKQQESPENTPLTQEPTDKRKTEIETQDHESLANSAMDKDNDVGINEDIDHSVESLEQQVANLIKDQQSKKITPELITEDGDPYSNVVLNQDDIEHTDQEPINSKLNKENSTVTKQSRKVNSQTDRVQSMFKNKTGRKANSSTNKQLKQKSEKSDNSQCKNPQDILTKLAKDQRKSVLQSKEAQPINSKSIKRTKRNTNKNQDTTLVKSSKLRSAVKTTSGIKKVQRKKPSGKTKVTQRNIKKENVD